LAEEIAVRAGEIEFAILGEELADGGHGFGTLPGQELECVLPFGGLVLGDGALGEIEVGQGGHEVARERGRLGPFA
jgi:hypothetical protein